MDFLSKPFLVKPQFLSLWKPGLVCFGVVLTAASQQARKGTTIAVIKPHYFQAISFTSMVLITTLCQCLKNSPVFQTYMSNSPLATSTCIQANRSSTCPKQNSPFSELCPPNPLLSQCPPCFINDITVHPVGKTINLTITWHSSPLDLVSNKWLSC